MLPDEYSRLNLLKSILKSSGIGPDDFPIDWLATTPYFRDPAAKRYHNNCRGGLFAHSLNLLHRFRAFKEGGLIFWENPRSPIVVAMLHDVTKIGSYSIENNAYVTNPDYVSYGAHGEDSVIKIEKVFKLTDEERACIRYHMGAYETDVWPEYEAAIKRFPNVLWTHHADMIASKLMEDTYETPDG